MHQSFWLSRWQQNDIGFHKDQPHSFLVENFERLQMSDGDKLLVPLCGKSLDLLWLRDHGADVIGTELSRIAVESFFSENSLTPTVETVSPFRLYSADRLKLLCGDHFALQPADLQGARAVYDRAALVALPPDLRQHYAAHLARLLPEASRILLVSYEYDQSETFGPPFAVSRTEIQRLFGSSFEIEVLDVQDTLTRHQGLRTRGVTQLFEFSCLLIRQNEG